MTGLRPVSAPPFRRSSTAGMLNLKSCELRSTEFDRRIEDLLGKLDASHVRSYPWLNEARRSAATWIGCAPEQLLLTPGSDPAIGALVSVLGTQVTGLALSTPIFESWHHYADAYGVPTSPVPVPPVGSPQDWTRYLADVDALPAGTLVGVSDPCSFAGTTVPRDVLDELLRTCQRRGHWLVVDACHAEMAGVDHRHLVGASRTLLVRSFSKSHGLAGLRIAALVGEDRIIDYLARFRLEASVSAPAAALLRHLVDRDDPLSRARQQIRELRDWLAEHVVAALPTWRPLAPGATFLTFCCDDAAQAARVEQHLGRHDVRVRDVTGQLGVPAVRVGLIDGPDLRRVATLLIEGAQR